MGKLMRQVVLLKSPIGKLFTCLVEKEKSHLPLTTSVPFKENEGVLYNRVVYWPSSYKK